MNHEKINSICDEIIFLTLKTLIRYKLHSDEGERILAKLVTDANFDNAQPETQDRIAATHLAIMEFNKNVDDTIAKFDPKDVQRAELNIKELH